MLYILFAVLVILCGPRQLLVMILILDGNLNHVALRTCEERQINLQFEVGAKQF